MSKSEKILVLGDHINTDDIIAVKHLTNPDPDYLKNYGLEYLIGEGKLLEYDIIEAGENFGCGSGREEAPIVIQAAGIRKVRAVSFAEIFYRNSINIGLPLEIIGKSETQPLVEAIAAEGGLTPFNQKRRRLEVSTPQSITQPRPMTMAEKILARASGNAYVQPGEIVFAKVDLAMSYDAVVGIVAQTFQQHFGEEAKLWDANKVVLVADHLIQINELREDKYADILYRQMLEFARQQGCHLFDVVSPGEAAGICHVLLPEKGFIRPGTVVVGTDSHSCTYGAFGCFATGVGYTEMANIFAMGDTWLRVPGTILFNLSGTLPKHISAKDIILYIISIIGCNGAIGKVIEFRGSIIKQLPIDERMTLANMAVECGAMSGLITPDNVTIEYVKSRTNEEFEEIIGDPDAEYEKVYEFDLSNLEAQVACPHTLEHIVGISQLGEILITRAFIGSCTGGKLFDLAQAAEVLQNRKIAPGVSMFVVPASVEVRQKAQELGYLDIFEKAGVQVLKSGCGACSNTGIGVLGKEETGVYATNRNFKGRSGDPSAKNYLASPRVVAISAIQGRIANQL